MTKEELKLIDKFQNIVQKYFKNILKLPCPDFRFNLEEYKNKLNK